MVDIFEGMTEQEIDEYCAQEADISQAMADAEGAYEDAGCFQLNNY
jgi:hypothetical protein